MEFYKNERKQDTRVVNMKTKKQIITFLQGIQDVLALRIKKYEEELEAMKYRYENRPMYASIHMAMNELEKTIEYERGRAYETNYILERLRDKE